MASSSVGSVRHLASGRLPLSFFRREGPAREVLKRGVVGSDQAGSCPGFDRHVAHRHAFVHRHRTDRRSAVFDDEPGGAAEAELGNQRKHDVFRRHTGMQRAGHIHGEGFERRLQQALRGKGLLDFARPNANRQRAECAVRRRVAITTHDGHAGLRQPQFRADDVHDALMLAREAIACDPELPAVVLERIDLGLHDAVDDGQATARRRNRVIDRRHGEVWAADLQSSAAQTVEGLRRRELVQEMQIDVNEGGSAVAVP